MDQREVVTVPDDGAPLDVELPRIGRFDIVKLLATGGMGVVFEGRDPVLGRRVALKLLHTAGPRRTAPARLLREAQALAKLAHPNVVAVFEIGMAGEDPFIAMELVEGETLATWMRTPREWRDVLDLFIAVGHGLAAGHALGLVHRDFKPGNVFVDKRGTPKLGDFGLVNAVHEEASPANAPASDVLTKPGAIMGTPAYMAPEQARGEPVDARADQFSFAKSLREALGEVFPSALEPLIARAMSDEPDDRFPAMEPLLDELARVRRGNRRTWIAVGIAGAIAGAAVLAFGLGHARQTADDPCPAPRAQLGAAWGPFREAALMGSAVAVDPRQGPARVDAARRLLDPYVEQWASLSVQTCRATRVEHTQSDTLFDLHMRCLDRRLAELSGSVDRIFSASNPAQLDTSVAALPQLTTVSSCADTERATRELDLPLDPVARLTAESLAARIQAIELDRRSDRLGGLTERARAVVADAQNLGHPSTLVAALAVQLRSNTTTNETTDLETIARELTQQAARAHRDEDEAFAWTELVEILGNVRGKPEEGLALVPVANAAILRAGDPEVLRLRLMLSQAKVLDTGPTPKKGLELLARARTQLVERGAEKPGSPLAELLADVLHEYAQTLIIAGDYAGAVVALRETIARYRALRGPDSTDEALTVHNLGLALYEAGNPSEALAAFREAARINEQRGALARLGSNYISIATTLGASEKYDEALAAYDRAVALLRDRSQDDPNTLGGLLLGRATARKHSGHLREARAGYDEAIAVFDRAGAVGTNLPIARYNRGELALEEGRWADALGDDQRAVTEFEKIGGPSSRFLMYPLVSSGKALVMLGRANEAVPPLERGLSLAAAKPGMQAAAEAWLARALGVTRGDRDRIARLTASALATLRELAAKGDPSSTVELRTFKEWLATHR